MPDHRKSVVTSSDQRPESKKGFEINPLDHPDTSNAGMRQGPNRTNYTSNKEQMEEMTEDIEEPDAFENEPYFGQGKRDTFCIIKTTHIIKLFALFL
jgi:hypothetical protein